MFRAGEFDDLQAVVCSALAQDPMDMVFHGLFREVEVRCYFFIREAASNHGEQFPLMR